MPTQPLDQTFVPIRVASNKLGLPESWLRTEAKAGRLPHVRAGSRVLIHLAKATEVLTHRATGQPEVLDHRERSRQLERTAREGLEDLDRIGEGGAS